jgi:hypothetical protein
MFGKPGETASPTAPVSRNLLDSLEKLTKIAGIVAVFGYLSLRSHLNFLGVPSQATLGVDRYLMEAYQFLSALCYSPDLLLLVLAAGLCISLAQARAADPSTHFTVWRKLEGHLSLTKWLRGGVPPLALIIGACGLMLRELQLMTLSGTAVAVGALRESSNKMALAAMPVRAAGEDHFLLVALFCAGGIAAYRLRPRDLAPFPTAVWKSFAFALILLALQLPILYGAFLRPAIYSKVEVRQKDYPAVCGALIVDTGERLVLWRANNGRGWVEVLSSKDAHMRALGDVDVLAEAGRSFKKLEDIPSCEDTQSR